MVGRGARNFAIAAQKIYEELERTLKKMTDSDDTMDDFNKFYFPPCKFNPSNYRYDYNYPGDPTNGKISFNFD